MTATRVPNVRLSSTGGWMGYAFASAVILLGFALAFVADRYLSVANLSPVFLTVVLVVAVRTRMSVAVYTALLCFLGYNFFFTAPRGTLAIADADDLLAVVLFLVVALVSGRLATRLASQVASLRAARARTQTLLELGQRLAGCADPQALCEAAVQAVARDVDADVALLQRDAGGAWSVRASTPPGTLPDARELARLDAAFADRDGPVPGMPLRSAWTVPLGGHHEAGALLLRPRGPRDPLLAERHRLALEMARDIGLALERCRLAAALEEARVQGETERLRNALLASVSHDLRSPLASMIGAASTLLAYEAQLPPGERRELVESILGEGQRLDRYIQNLLDMTRLGHGTLKLNRDWVDAAEIVLAAVGRLRRYHPAVAVETRLPTGTVLLYVHPALIEQALFNILENGAQVSPPDCPLEVTAGLVDGGLRIEVADRGPGIPEQERMRIFDTFYSVARGDRAPRGTGLGLSICRGMIGAHGGGVEVFPRPGGGTVFRVTLPVPPAPEAAA